MSKAIKKAETIIESLEKDWNVFDHVIKWMIEKEYDRKFKKCRKCEKVDAAGGFHGRTCPECHKENKHNIYLGRKEKN